MKHLIFLAVLFGVAFYLVHNRIGSLPYGYDEADYMFAASQGVEANWLDRGTVPITDFVRAGLQRGTVPGGLTALSALERSSPDTLFQRHWHGPLYYYWLTVMRHLQVDEHSMRFLSLLFPGLTALVMYFGSSAVLGGLQGQVAGMLASMLFLWSPVTLQSTELAPHMLFVLCSVSALLLLAKVAAGGGRRYYYAAAVCSGLAFCTLEVALVLIAVMLFVVWWRRESLAPDRRFARDAAALFIVPVLVIWPTSLLKLSFIKSYIVMAFLAIFRKAAWGDITFAQTWRLRFLTSPVEWILILVALLCLAQRDSGYARYARKAAITFLLFAGLMILAMLPVYSETQRYATPFLAGLDLFAAWTLSSLLVRPLRPRITYATLAAICGLLYLSAAYELSTYVPAEDHRQANALNALRVAGLENKTVLIPEPDFPTLHYYLPKMRAQPYANTSAIPAELRESHFDAVLYPDYSLRMNPSPAEP
ncbi:MAG TPA: glycosyltransferase family 39 protein [Bryobacteraceae bacterium]|nr:glycosyltransferase family 39 protein [Bryobacteraceae bacterium]